MSMTEDRSSHTATRPLDGTSAVRHALSTDDVFHLLQRHRRRAAIRYLRGRNGAVEIGDLAEQVVA